MSAQFRPTSKRQELFLASNSFLTIFGGAASGGKSYTGLMRFLNYIHDPNFVGYVFRQIGADIRKEGGLFWTAVKMFQQYDPDVTYTTQPMVIKFPHPDPVKRKRKVKGATISFTGLDDQDGMNAIQGINISAAMVDEATQIGEEEFWWLITRLRTEANMTPNLWLTCNPDDQSFVLRQFVHWWLYPRGTIADIVSTNIYEKDLKNIQVNDRVFIELYEDGELVKTYETGGHITLSDNVQFFSVAGSISVHRGYVDNGVRLFTSIPRLTENQAAFLVLKRKGKEVFKSEMTVDGQEDVGGRPDIEKNGKQLYYLNVENKVHLATSLDELYEELPEYKGHPTIVPDTVSFIGATCKDNPTYLLKNPAYESKLQNQPRLKREQLYYGNWYAKEEGAGYFRREWLFEPLRQPLPDDQIQSRVRCFDLASSEPTEANPNPDWTVGVLIAKTKSGLYVIEDMVRFRKRAGEVEQKIIDIIEKDVDLYGSDKYKGYLPIDPGAAGKTSKIYYAKLFAERKVPVRFIKVGTKNSKMKRFEPFSASSENELVRIVKGDWNDDFFYELEAFGGTNKNVHDDIVDSVSDGFNVLATKKELPKINAKLLKMS